MHCSTIALVGSVIICRQSLHELSGRAHADAEREDDRVREVELPTVRVRRRELRGHMHEDRRYGHTHDCECPLPSLPDSRGRPRTQGESEHAIAIVNASKQFVPQDAALAAQREWLRRGLEKGP